MNNSNYSYYIPATSYIQYTPTILSSSYTQYYSPFTTYSPQISRNSSKYNDLSTYNYYNPF